jgi:hypothetical protein
MRASTADLLEATSDYQDWWEAWELYMRAGDPRVGLARTYVKLCEVRLLAVARGEPLMQLARKARDAR